MPLFRRLGLFLIAFLSIQLSAVSPPALAMELTSGVPVEGEIFGGEADFTVDGEEGDLISVGVADRAEEIGVSLAVPVVDLFIRLPGAPLEDNVSLGSDLGGYNDVRLPFTGTVTVRVKPDVGPAGDAYFRLTLYFLDPPEKQNATDFPLGETVSDNFVASDARYFRFQAQDGDTLTYDFEDTGSPSFPTARFDIFGPDLTEPPWVEDLSPSGGTVSVVGSGVHTVRVRDCACSFGMTSFSLDLSLTPGERRFIRGDTNGDGTVNIADPSFLANFIFGIAPATPPPCAAAANANGDASTNIADVSFVANFLFGIDPATAPPAPHPDCGPGNLDVDAALGCDQSGVGCD